MMGFGSFLLNTNVRNGLFGDLADGGSIPHTDYVARAAVRCLHAGGPANLGQELRAGLRRAGVRIAGNRLVLGPAVPDRRRDEQRRAGVEGDAHLEHELAE